MFETDSHGAPLSERHISSFDILSLVEFGDLWRCVVSISEEALKQRAFELFRNVYPAGTTINDISIHSSGEQDIYEVHVNEQVVGKMTAAGEFVPMGKQTV